ncbi:MAG TPA: tRNA (adenosine(37)-N6)-threonylcarbamoyltransferase complex dimerization subunit type 1 TsaB [Vicinamibacterales bacterium]|nr:tRNA (adenosine(37)-N6)-threonylcarbamoyltransferase complex dimerization subunit type 1 TsaB [Vicinamibacterales bacterium]
MGHTSVLALDTTSRAGSLALLQDDGRLTMLVGDAARTHGERLPGDIAALLARAGARLSDVELFAVVNGPGSFTGLRVGIAAVQGLALAQDRRVVPVPALEAFALAEEVGNGTVGVWIDAQRRQVFAARYRKTGGTLAALGPAVSLPPDEVAARWREDGAAPETLVGGGIDLFEHVARRAWPGARIVAPAPPLAPIAARIASARPELAVPPHAIAPIYVRAADAEIVRDRSSRARER